MQKGSSPTFRKVFNEILHESPKKFFSGIVPRVFWISIGGSVFLGTYEFMAGLIDTGK